MPVTNRPTRLSAGVTVEEVDDGLIVHTGTIAMHRLNCSASLIFELCDGTRDVQEIADIVADLFALDERPLLQTISCIQDLRSKGLILAHTVDEPSLRMMSPAPSMLASLFVVSLPRSGSSLAYTSACKLLGLRQPSWTEVGEILNPDRIKVGGRTEVYDWYLRKDKDPSTFESLLEFLETTVQPHAYGYKDVVQPFVVASWVGLRRLSVLHIRRDPAEVAYAMLRQGWYYPTFATGSPISTLEYPFPEDDTGLHTRYWMLVAKSTVEGLLLAERALESVPAIRLEFDDLFPSRAPLVGALEQLYPDTKIPAVHANADEISRSERRVERIRQSRWYGILRDIVADCRERLNPLTVTSQLDLG